MMMRRSVSSHVTAGVLTQPDVTVRPTLAEQVVAAFGKHGSR